MWRVLPLKSVVTEQRESVNPAALGDQLVDHYSIPALDLTGKPEVVPAREIQSSKQSLKGGEVIVSRLNPRKARVHNVPDPHERIALASGEFIVMQPRHIEARFLKYCLLAESTRQYLDSRVQSVTRSHQRIRPEILMKLPISTPDLPQQQAIADYLDSETARIDALISKKRRLLALLESRLIALAEDAIKGCDSDKATEIPSLPVISSSWRILRNKVFTREINHRSVDENNEMLSVSHITGVTPRSEKTVYMFEAESTVGYKLVRPGDLVINTMWAWMGAAGVSDVHGIVSPAYGVYEFDNSIVLPEFFDILVRTPAYIAEMTRFSRGVTSSRLRLYPDEFLRLSSPVPPVKTQQAIVDRYAHHQSTASQACKRISDQIQLLQERRQALITAVVTGDMPPPTVTV